MIRVANVLTLGHFGGPQHRVLQVAARLLEHDIVTTVILPREGSDEMCERLAAARVPVVRLPMHRLTWQKSHLAAYGILFGPELGLLVAALLRERADIVHCNGVSQVKSALAGRLAGKRVVLHLNDTYTTPAMQVLYRMVAPLCHGYIFAAERAKAAHPPHVGRADALVRTIPAPVDTARFDPDVVRPDPALSAERGPRVITAGVISPAKGLESFVEVAALVRRRCPEATFHVIGGQLDSQRRYFAEIRRRVADLPPGTVTFRGSSTDMPASYRAGDVYVCSSTVEASPMAVWEAMSMALPVVSTDVGDVARYIDDGRSGYIVPVGDAVALADRVARLLDDPERRRTMGREARRVAVERLNVERCVQLHRDFYRELLADSGHSPTDDAASRRGSPPAAHRRRTGRPAMRIGIDGTNIRAGGGITHLVELLRAADLDASGVDSITVWANRRVADQAEERDDIRIVRVPQLEGWLPERIYWEQRELARLARESCDVLLVPGGSYVGPFRPYVTMSQNMLPFEPRERGRYPLGSWQRLRSRLLEWSQTTTFRSAAGVIFLTQTARRVVERRAGPFPGLSAVVPHGVGDAFRMPPRPQEPLTAYGPHRPFRWLYVSVVDFYKHQWAVAEAVAAERQAGLPVAVDFVGPAYDPAARRLRSVLEARDPGQTYMKYHGPVPYRDLPDWYRRADGFVFASSCEANPIILLEAMASGLPIACARRGPMPEVLGDGGVYFDPEQPREIEAAMRTLMADPSRRARHAAAAHRTALRYTWARCASETLAFIVEAAQRAAPTAR